MLTKLRIVCCKAHMHMICDQESGAVSPLVSPQDRNSEERWSVTLLSNYNIVSSSLRSSEETFRRLRSQSMSAFQRVSACTAATPVPLLGGEWSRGASESLRLDRETGICHVIRYKSESDLVC